MLSNDVSIFSSQVSFDALNLQLSYNDIRLFLGILNSMPQQLLQAQQQAPPRNAPEDSRHGKF